MLDPHLESALKSPATRRQALALLSLTAMIAAQKSSVADQIPVPQPPGNPTDDGTLDEALALLQRAEPECKGGMSTHAPMAAEALCALGSADKVLSWVERYDAPLLRIPVAANPIRSQDWRALLGPRKGTATWEEANPRWADWRQFFLAGLSETPWRELLDTWAGRLAPGMSGAATHGVIRTAHAVRSLARRDTPQRRGELARGLAYWASAYEELPARPYTGRRHATYAGALADVPFYREKFGHKPEGRNIVETLRHVTELERFADARDLVAEQSDVGAAISALTATFAHVYLRHGTQGDTIAFVHAVTGPCSLRRIAPHISPGTARAALPYAWQSAAAIYAAYALGRDERREAEPKLSRAELAHGAIENGDEHAIKFTEVMLAEHQINPDPVYLAAAQDAVARL